MAVFAPSAGCVYRPTATGGTGSYAIDGLPRGNADSPILVTGADLSVTDVTLPVTTLNKLKILYTFGEAFGDVHINGLCLLGQKGKGSLDQVTSWFQGNRVTAAQKTINLSTPGGGFKVFCTGIGLSQPDAQYNIQPFVIIGMVAESS